jgi:hypothetical protein
MGTNLDPIAGTHRHALVATGSEGPNDFEAQPHVFFFLKKSVKTLGTLMITMQCLV